MNATQKSLKNPGKAVRGDDNDYYLTDGRGFIWVLKKLSNFWFGEMGGQPGRVKYKGETRKQLVESILSNYPIY